MNKWIVILALALSSSPVFSQEVESSTETTADAAEVVVEATTETAVVEESAELTAVEESTQEVPMSIEEAAATASRAPVFVVILPERIDHAWYWLFYSDTSQHIVQSAVEKALIRAGLNVIDLQTATLPSFGTDMMQLQSINYAIKAGRQLKADFVISGQATAVKASEGQAYGVNVVRTQAEVTAKIIRVSDGKILEVEDASVLEGGQSVQAAGQNALKRAGTQVAGKIVRTASKLTVSETPAP